MSRITGVIVALATTAAVLATSASGAEPPAPGGEPSALPRDIPRGVELTMADGDLLRVWAADTYRAVWARRRDAATGTWGPRAEVLRRKDLYCGDVDARTANGAVAVLAQCDRHGYAEDQAPTASRAIWSPDGVTWTSYALDGEAHEEPGISPDGQNAVWPQHGRYTTRTAAGFAEHELDADGQEYTVTATITDTAQVSFLYFAQLGRRCRLVVQTRTGDATPARQELKITGGCSDVALANVDSDTVWYGDPAFPAQRAVVSRADAASPWAVTEIAPVNAPGLYQTWRKIDRDFFTAPGLPLFALGSTDGRTVQAQAYDRVAQAWRPPSTVLSARARCRWADNSAIQPLGVVAAGLVCGRGNQVVLTTRDGSTWHAVRGAWNTRGFSPDGRYVAIPARTRTYVLSPERGVTTLPGGVTGPCDVVVPDGPDGAVLLTAAGRNRGWPTVLKHSAADGWTRLSRTSLPIHRAECRWARASLWDLPHRFDVRSGHGVGHAVQIVERAGGWTVRRTRW